ncbi:ewing's tumor-associated antigen 1 [Gastrophryne carolinensis]
MASRRRQAADRNEQSREEAKERREPGRSDRDTPRKSRSKRLSRSSRAQQASPAPRSDRDDDFSSNKKTPSRLSNYKPWTSAIHSPSNEAEQQHEIFWDPNSPTSFRLENGKKKQTSRKCTVEISDIVNRIAPKDEKPTTSDAAYLGIWIGDDAIPCTPVVSRPRTKLHRSRILKTENELMELAKKLDRNLVENKEQHVDKVAEAAQSTVNEATVQDNNCPFLEDIVEEGLKSVSQSSAAAAQNSQKSVDQEAEDALNALFDCSTQKVSGRLSQGFSDISTSSFQGVSVHVKNTDRESPLLSKDQSEKNASSGSHVVVTKLHSDIFVGENKCSKQNITSETEKGAADMVLSVSSSQDDFEDDWGEDILEDDSFVMQITQNPELIATPVSSKAPVKSNLCGLAALDEKLDAKTKASSFIENNSFKFVSKKLSDREGTKLKPNFPRNLTVHVQKTQEHSRDQDCSYKTAITEAQGPSGGQNIKANPAPKSFANASNCEVPKTYTFSSKSLSSRGEKDQPVKKCINTVVQTNASSTNLESVNCDEWDDPKFSDEVLDMFCKSDGLWDKEEDDDDLLYEVCNNVEKLTQAQVPEKATSFSSSHKGSTKTVSDNKMESFNATTYSCSSKFSGFAPNSTKGITKGSSPASVSGNCVNTFQSSSAQRTNQATGTFNRSNSVPSGVECTKTKLKEPNPQTSISSITTATHSQAPSKYTFTRIKPSQVLSAHTNTMHTGSGSNPLQRFGESQKLNSLTNVFASQQTSLKRHLSESTIHSSKVFVSEVRSKKCSTEEIERKKQEALARRQMKARAFSSDRAPT